VIVAEYELSIINCCCVQLLWSSEHGGCAKTVGVGQLALVPELSLALSFTGGTFHLESRTKDNYMTDSSKVKQLSCSITLNLATRT